MINTGFAVALDEIKGGVFQQISEIELSTKGEQEFRKFRSSRNGYGAMYVSPDGVRGGWRDNMFSLQSAELLAKTICEVNAKVECVLLGRIVPRNQPGEVAIPQRAQSDFRKAIRETRSQRFAAFAIHGLGGWGWANNFNTVEEARESAILNCQASAARERAKLGRERRAAFDRAKLFDCKVIHSVQKR
ncbi:hypothetical protein KUV51_07555 [Tateyamaria omphalii]|uniref:hypothetical protein n=1 Tax=Tateyamaria omphalii TaxID=299262 RepID=UPI001C9992DF|nr:hypothetical protein [Tateyamaria omphalii]MBY5932851.1 hypothetical protein [Tateyamaria omphalii]